jgi:hypothetical protein
MHERWICGTVCTIALGVGGCGAEPPSAFAAQGDAASVASGSYAAEGRVLEYEARSSSPFVAEVALQIGSLLFDARYDYPAREVVTDGHGLSLDRPAHQLLGQAISALSAEFGSNATGMTFPEQALYATLVTWQQSGGIPLGRRAYSLAGTGLAEAQAAQSNGERVISKSVEDDGIECVQEGTSYLASFDFGDTIVIDQSVTAGDRHCDGLCGPDCVRLTPFEMWTLDCLEHDACCGATDTPDCWVPLGECADEYEHAIADFLRGFDPLSRHCGG